MRAWAMLESPRVVNLDRETAQFLDHHAAKGSLMLDWTRAWYTWMRNAERYAKQAGVPLPSVRRDPTMEWMFQ